MTVNCDELIAVISELANEENIRVTVQQSAKGATYCGVCCFIGGLLLGPAGLAIGGAAGSLVAYNMTKGTFRPLGDVIKDLNETQKKKLVQHVIDAVQDAHPTDLVKLILYIQSTPCVKQVVLKAVKYYVCKELNFRVIS